MSYDRMTNVLELLRETEQKLIAEFLEDLRSLHDYTFINVTDANKVIYLRDNIEEGLKKWEAKKNE